VGSFEGQLLKRRGERTRKLNFILKKGRRHQVNGRTYEGFPSFYAKTVIWEKEDRTILHYYTGRGDA